MSLSFSSLSRGSLQLLARRITFAPHARALCVAANVSSNETSELPPKQTSFERRSRKLNDILQGYVREQKFDAVEEAFKKGLAEGIAPDKLTYNILIRSNLALGKTQEAEDIIRDTMPNAGFQPSVFSFNAFITHYAMTGMVHEGKKWLDRMRQLGLTPNYRSYLTLFRAQKHSQLSGALLTLEEMRRDGYKPSEGLYIDLIFKARLEVKAHVSCSALSLLLEDHGVSNPQVIFAVLDGSLKSWNIDGVVMAYEALKGCNAPIDVTILRHVHTCFNSHGRPDLAQEVSQQIRTATDEEGVLAFLEDSNVYGLSLACQFEQAVHAVERMEKGAQALSKSSFEALANAFALSIDAMDKTFFDLSSKYGPGSTVGTAPRSVLNAIIRGCAQIGETGRAMDTMDEMKNTFGLQPDITSYNSLLRGFIRFGLTDAAFQTLDRMDREGLEGDHDTMEYKIMAYVQSGKLDEAKRLTMEFVENAPLYARNAAEMTARGLARAGDASYKEVLQKMRSKDVRVTRRLGSHCIELFSNGTTPNKTKND